MTAEERIRAVKSAVRRDMAEADWTDTTNDRPERLARLHAACADTLEYLDAQAASLEARWAAMSTKVRPNHKRWDHNGDGPCLACEPEDK